ncbi:hypothetical protein [Sphingobacterium corticibacter]|uniref:Uncharacterized protein n=1 Tax=Sphingobacterium corticibacter TaxID=2171749 RepID=A0A2T8HNJ9_9SPHI|nr:hypothetical protein [Sphingobacterium corticibacter]PVH27024.1 hypothetical protein DC487_05355 [Sphingobacterium corticibacter]
MKYVTLTHKVLRGLRDQGFNILRSTSPLSSENPSWYPDTVGLDDFMHWENNEFRLLNIPFEEKHLLVIQDALDNINEEDLIGEVWI